MNPHLLASVFDEDFYLDQLRSADSTTTKMRESLLAHYLETGWRENRNPHRFFDVSWYLKYNPDVAAAGIDPLGHYFSHGWKEGRLPHPKFEALIGYLAKEPTVLWSKVCPLVLAPKHISPESEPHVHPMSPERFSSNYNRTRPYRHLDYSAMASRVARYQTSRQSSNKIALCTCITGGYDTLRIPEHLSPEIDYHVFTDQPTDGYGVFHVHLIKSQGADATRHSRYIKLHLAELMEQYDTAIWCDANLVVRDDLHPHLNAFVSSGLSLAFVPHLIRTCIYNAAVVCAQTGKDSAERIVQQMIGYQREGYPANHGLIHANFFACRPQRSETRAFFKEWWEQLSQGSRRDQLSANYVLWKQRLSYFPLLGEGQNTRTHPGFAVLEHGRHDAAHFAAFAAGKQTFEPYAAPVSH